MRHLAGRASEPCGKPNPRPAWPVAARETGDKGFGPLGVRNFIPVCNRMKRRGRCSYRLLPVESDTKFAAACARLAWVDGLHHGNACFSLRCLAGAGPAALEQERLRRGLPGCQQVSVIARHCGDIAAFEATAGGNRRPASAGNGFSFGGDRAAADFANMGPAMRARPMPSWPWTPSPGRADWTRLSPGRSIRVEDAEDLNWRTRPDCSDPAGEDRRMRLPPAPADVAQGLMARANMKATPPPPSRRHEFVLIGSGFTRRRSSTSARAGFSAGNRSLPLLGDAAHRQRPMTSALAGL